MAVQPVKYKETSSAGKSFAVKDTNKEVNSSTAKQIYKDSMQGFTEVTSSNLNNNDTAQAIGINQLVNPDEVEYTSEEARNIGKNQIDTEDAEEFSDAKKKAGGSMAVIGGAAGTAGSVAFGTIGKELAKEGVCVGVEKGAMEVTTEAGEKFASKGAQKIAEKGAEQATGQQTGQQVTNELTESAAGADGFTQLIIAGIMFAFAVIAAATAWAVDPAFLKRKSENEAAEATNNTINQESEVMTDCMNTMVEEQAQYEELSTMKLETMMTTLDQNTALRTEQATYICEGNAEKSNELQKQIDEKTTEGASQESEFDTQLEPLQKNLSEYSNKASEAHGVKDSGTVVANFLDEGKLYGWLAIASGVLNTVSAVTTAIATAAAWPKCAFDAPACIAAKVLFIAATALYAGAAVINFMVADGDFKAVKSAETMNKYLETLGQNADGTDGFVTETGSAYANMDGASAGAYQEASEGAQEVVNNTKDQNNKNMTFNLTTGGSNTPNTSNAASSTPNTSGAPV